MTPLGQKSVRCYSQPPVKKIKNKVFSRHQVALESKNNDHSTQNRKLHQAVVSVCFRKKIIPNSLFSFYHYRAPTSLNQQIICKWVNHDSPIFDFWFDLIFKSQVIHDWRVNRDLRRIKIKPNRNESQTKMNCESKRINRIRSLQKWIKMNQNQK